MAKSENLAIVEKIFEESIFIKKDCINQGFDSISKIGEIAVSSILDRNKILLFGNGGSAADAQHIAAELLIRPHPDINREGIPAIFLTQDTSSITACGNDYGFEIFYKRMILSLGRSGDCLIAISTLGNSQNIILAMKVAKNMGIKVVDFFLGFLGCGGGEALNYCDEAFIVPRNDTGRIQEAHITAGHVLVEYIEVNLLKLGFLHLQN